LFRTFAEIYDFNELLDIQSPSTIFRRIAHLSGPCCGAGYHGGAIVTYTEPLLTLTLALSWIGIYFLGPSRAKRFLTLSLLAISLIAWPPCEYLLSRPLEWRYPLIPFSTPAGSEAIVVFGSAVSPAQFERPYPLPDADTFERCQYAAWIYRKTRLPMLISGGTGSTTTPPVATTMRKLLLGAGVTRGDDLDRGSFRVYTRECNV
jgi:hypothetical protein